MAVVANPLVEFVAVGKGEEVERVGSEDGRVVFPTPIDPFEIGEFAVMAL